MLHTKTSILSLRRQFAGLPDRAAKQIGLRRLRDALRYVDREDMREHVAKLVAEAEFQLPYAKNNQLWRF